MSSDGLGKYLGRFTDAVVDDSRVYADLHFSPAAHSTPDGDLARYVAELAENDPDQFGTSIVFERDLERERAFLEENTHRGRFVSPDETNKNNLPHARLARLRAIDTVDEPAANPRGLFHRGDIPSEAGELMAYALRLPGAARPDSTAFSIDPDRAASFVERFLARNGLTLEPTKKKDSPTMTDSNQTRAEFVEELSTYTQTFGAERGAQWFAEGKPLEECYQERCRELQSENDALAAQVTDLERRLSDAAAVGGDPEDFNAAGGTPAEKSGFRARFSLPADRAAQN